METEMSDAGTRARARPRVKAIHIDERYCSGCGICIEFCPHHVLAASEAISANGVYPAVVIDLERCTVCRLCELYCGNFAIAVEEAGDDG